MNVQLADPGGRWSVQRTAAYLDVADQTVRDAIKRGDLTASRCGRRILVDPNSVQELLRRTSTGDAA